MALKARVSNNLLPKGMHEAVCFGVVEVGTYKPGKVDEKTGKFKGYLDQKTGEDMVLSNQVMFFFEFKDLKITREVEGLDKELPGVTSMELKNSFHTSSKMTEVMDSWLSLNNDEKNDLDLQSLIGKHCVIQINHKTKNDGTQKDVIQNILPSTSTDWKATNADMIFDYGMDVIPDNVYNWVKEKLVRSAQGREKWGEVKEEKMEDPGY